VNQLGLKIDNQFIKQYPVSIQHLKNQSKEMNQIIYTNLKEQLFSVGFKEKAYVSKSQKFRFAKALVLKTLNINRAVVVIDISNSDFVINKSSIDLLKKEIRTALGYVLFFYSMGIQLVFITDKLPAINIQKLVDKYDNLYY
jgi:hypothetical protein